MSGRIEEIMQDGYRVVTDRTERANNFVRVAVTTTENVETMVRGINYVCELLHVDRLNLDYFVSRGHLHLDGISAGGVQVYLTVDVLDIESQNIAHLNVDDVEHIIDGCVALRRLRAERDLSAELRSGTLRKNTILRLCFLV